MGDYIYVYWEILFIVIFLIVEIIFFLICLCGYSSEDFFIEVIKKEWKKYPILDLSITPKEGYEEITLLNYENAGVFCDCINVDKFRYKFDRECNDYEILSGCNGYNAKKASKIYNTTLYINYYKFDYLTLFYRLDSDYNGNICKDEYEKCGYLDIFNNVLCIERKGTCPINYNILFSLGKDGKIKEIIKDNDNKQISILNQLYTSELKSATIFNKDKLFLSPNSYNSADNPMEYYFSLNKINYYPRIRKSDFFLQNQLINGEIPSWFYNIEMNLYFSKYPGNKLEYPLNKYYIFIFQKLWRTLLKLFIIICYIYFISIFCFICCKDYIPDIPITIKIINIILQLIYLGLIVLNIFFLKAKYNLSRLLYFYENNIYKSGEISGKGGLTTFIFQIIIEVVPQIIIYIIFTLNNKLFLFEKNW